MATAAEPHRLWKLLSPYKSVAQPVVLQQQISPKTVSAADPPITVSAADPPITVSAADLPHNSVSNALDGSEDDKRSSYSKKLQFWAWNAGFALLLYPWTLPDTNSQIALLVRTQAPQECSL